MDVREAVIVDTGRTAIGKRKGALANWHPTDLLGFALRTVIERNVIFLACVAPAPTAAPACTDTNAIIKAKVNFPTNAAGAVSGAFVQSWSVN